MGIKDFFKKIMYKADIVKKETISVSLVDIKKEYLLARINNVYIGKFYITNFDFLYENIYQHILLLRQLNSYDIKNEYMLVGVRPPTEHIYKSISDWFTIDGHVINNSLDMLREWLELSEQLIVKHSEGRNNISNAIHNGNAVRLQPYIIHLERILEVMLKCI